MKIEYDRPPCFGVYWFGKTNQVCSQCVCFDDCFIRFCTERLMEAQKVVATEDKFDKQVLAAEIGVPIQAIELALSYQSTMEGKTRRPLLRSQIIEVVEPVFCKKEQDTVPKQKKAAKFGPSEYMEPEEPTKKELSYAQKLQYNKRKVKSIQRYPTKWSSKTDQARFERERSKHPELQFFEPGVVLTRIYNSKLYTLHFLSNGYLCDNYFFPTLYSATNYITGRLYDKPFKRTEGHEHERCAGKRLMTGFNFKAFWGIHKIVKKLKYV